MIREGKPVPYSGYKGGVGSILVFAVTVILFFAMLWVIGLWTFTNIWLWGSVTIALITVIFFIPKELVGRADTVNKDYIYDPAHMEREPGAY